MLGHRLSIVVHLRQQKRPSQHGLASLELQLGGCGEGPHPSRTVFTDHHNAGEGLQIDCPWGDEEMSAVGKGKETDDMRNRLVSEDRTNDFTLSTNHH